MTESIDWQKYDGRVPASVIQGEYKVSANPADHFGTILGSCVAVCLYHLEIGQKNANFVKGFLRDEAIRCVSESLGGTKARKIQFVPTLGLARQKLLEPTADLQRTEAPKPVVQPMADDITLF